MSEDWDGISVRGAGKLAATLQNQFEEAVLFRVIATIRDDAITLDDVEDLRWVGPTADFAALAASIDAPGLVARAERLAVDRS
mgnify:CR=1 FL=1